MSMSVRLAMEAVNKSALTQLDRLCARVIKAIAYHLIVQTALVSSYLMYSYDHDSIKF
jgi:hypothetical protein